MNTRTAALCLLLSVRAFAEPAATPADQLTVPPGFKVELLKSASPREGSWVSMAIDDKGRLYISPQAKAPDGGIMRVTLDDAGHIAQTDWLKPDVGAAMGMLWAFDSLYVSGQGPDGQGIYRLRDTDGDDQLDQVTLLKKVPGGGGEHGAHAIVLGPDKKLYFVHGNATPLIEGVDETNSHYRNYGEDILIPRVMDPVATFFDNLKVAYGHILRTDENGTNWELIAGGMRNAYDIDFNADGELFTYDSDMEWDVGLPWYRPTRILHLVPGGEYGFREGNQKWPDYYPDSLPPVCDIGLGCPTGVKFGTRSNFPKKYRRAFFAMDWTFGRILAVHMHPKGASYTASNSLKSYLHPTGPEASRDVEVFLSGKGMPLSDLEFGRDGAMYFTVGGRGTQGGLYRVSWSGEPQENDIRQVDPINISRDVRKMWEVFYDGSRVRAKYSPFEEKPISDAVLFLGDVDRFVRYAAILALGNSPDGSWRQALLDHPGPRHALSGFLALSRVGTKDDQAPLLKALAKFPLDSLDDELKLLKLRVIKVSFARQGRPAEDLVKLGIEKLSRQYPAKTFPLNRELSELLIWLGAPDAVEKTLALLEAAPNQEEQIWYACMLREAQGWTQPQRVRYFAWFDKAREFTGGNSLAKFILRIKEQAVAKLSETEKVELAAILNPPGKPTPAPAPAPARAFVKAWTMADLESALGSVGKGRNFARGRQLYADAQCARCHLFKGGGGNFGPDLSAVGSRFSRRDILEAILDPSKVISEQYATLLLTLKDGATIGGLLTEENNDHYKLIVDPLSGKAEVIGKGQVAQKERSPVSLMPPALLATLTKDEVLDLLAYLETGGNENAPAFTKD